VSLHALPILLAAALSQEWTLPRFRAELQGPLERVEVDCGRRGRTVLEGRLLEGERIEAILPLPVRPLGEGPVELIVEPEGGRASFEEWVTAETPPVPLPLQRPRVRPPLTSGPPRARWSALAILAAGALVGAALRRRWAWAAGVGVGTAAAVLAVQVARSPAGPGVVRVLEGHAASASWLRVDGALGELALPLEGTLALEVRPPDAAIEIGGELRDGSARWRAIAPGRELWRVAHLDPGVRRLTREANTWGRLEETWFRDAAGTWSARGPWGLGEPPPAEGAAGSPPGWLAAGLPQGVGVLVARLDPQTWPAAGKATSAPTATTWLRLVGTEFTAGR